MSDFHALPPDLPVAVDDGAADHLSGLVVPHLRLASTTGGDVDLSEEAQGLLVAYIYPRTGIPGEPLPEGWDQIPGARGCTPQACAFRDAAYDLAGLGARVLGISAQGRDEQSEFAQRVHIPYPLLSDVGLSLAATIRLPTFTVADMQLYRRLTFIAVGGRIEKVFYPVFPPDRNARDALSWLTDRAARR